MTRTSKIKDTISTVLLVGILIAISLVLMGGILFVIEHSDVGLKTELLQEKNYPIHIEQIWASVLSLSSIGLIQLGMVILVAMQMLRVAMLIVLYALLKDFSFVLIGLFILTVLFYSFFWHG